MALTKNFVIACLVGFCISSIMVDARRELLQFGRFGGFQFGGSPFFNFGGPSPKAQSTPQQPAPVAKQAPAIPVAKPAPVPVAKAAPVPVAKPAPVPVAQAAPVPVAKPTSVSIAAKAVPAPAVAEAGPGEPASATLPPVQPGSGGVFDVVKYGATPSATKSSTQAFSKAWIAACHWREKSVFIIPKGEFLIEPMSFLGPCNAPEITFQLDGTLKAATDTSLYTNGYWLEFNTVSNLIVTGSGTFDGQGPQFWKYNNCKGNTKCEMLPIALRFIKVTNSHISKIHSLNAMGFHFSINHCDNIDIQDVTVTAPDESPNTDGIHIGSSNGISILNSNIGTGDDCVSIVQGSTNINVTKVNCGPGHGISIGSLGKRPDEKNVDGIFVRNCTFTGTDNGARIKTWNDSPSLQASRIYFQDLIMNNVQNPIIIDQNYGGSKKGGGAPSNVQISDIKFMNIRGTTVSPIPISLICSPKVPCQKVQVADIDLKYTGTRPTAAGGATAECANAKIAYSGVQNPAACPV